MTRAIVASDFSLADIGWDLARAPTGTATVLGKPTSSNIRLLRRVPDTGVTSVGDTDDVVLGANSLSDPQGALSGEPPGLRRIGGRIFVLGPTLLASGFGGLGTCYYSTDDARSFQELLPANILDPFNGPDSYHAMDVNYDAAKDTLYVGLGYPNHGGATPNSVPFVKKAGIGGWEDLTGTMVVDLGGIYSCHLKGLVAGVRP